MYGYCTLDFYRMYRQDTEWANRANHRAFTLSLADKRQPKELDTKSTSLLTKAVNKPRLRTIIRQPVWRIGRWRSVTGGKGRQTV